MCVYCIIVRKPANFGIHHWRAEPVEIKIHQPDAKPYRLVGQTLIVVG